MPHDFEQMTAAELERWLENYNRAAGNRCRIVFAIGILIVLMLGL